MTIIRQARPADVPAMLEMLRASAEEQGSVEKLVVDEENLAEDGFGPNPRFHCAIAEVDEIAAGIALYFRVYSTWVTRNGLYLEDLYVKPEFRRMGVGKRLLDHLMEIARREGCGRVQWVVNRENAGAIALYRASGAEELDGWVLMNVRC